MGKIFESGKLQTDFKKNIFSIMPKNWGAEKFDKYGISLSSHT